MRTTRPPAFAALPPAQEGGAPTADPHSPSRTRSGFFVPGATEMKKRKGKGGGKKGC